jgi:hypothetical protein
VLKIALIDRTSLPIPSTSSKNNTTSLSACAAIWSGPNAIGSG